MHRAAVVGTRLLTVAAPLQLRLPVRLLRSTAAALVDFTVVVPHMSESISEGIVSELPKPIGSGVAVDDIVAVLETDKVSFQVRTTQAGVVKSIAVSTGETVPVGAPLLVLDTDGKASAAAAPAAGAAAPAAAAPAAKAPAPAPAAAAASAASSSHGHAGEANGHGHRVPSIRFRYGKREAAPAAAPARPVSAPSKGSPAAAAIPGYAGGDYNEFLARIAPSKAKDGKTYLDLPPAYGRPALSAREMAAIDSGGAL